ncbi:MULTISPECIES: extracellular solute-binding protein [Cohnella]|uniref:Extracellular solute-binding protein n=1 Tax=Cohnella hashimotonis TaxID=2826895 RepID=A0ABT6TAY3_9BACL|nr:extracellular solute-binding protein [Cohnella hashimotonis]MDI4643448.1 extracellular solute-binding protein [Cohnella hashimotonis]
MKRESEFLYTKLYKTLKEQIGTGIIKPGEFLLPENELSSRYGISRKSVRHALSLLLADGLIEKRAGLGTLVPEDLVIAGDKRRTLRILTPSPAFFLDHGLPVFVEAFERQYPDVEVKVHGLPVDKFWESFRSGSEMGLIADLILVPDMQFSKMSNLADFVDLSPFLTGQIDTVYPKIMKHFAAGDRIMAAPFTFSSAFFACNPELFKRHGIPIPEKQWNFDDFVSAAAKLTVVQDGITTQYGFSMHPVINRWLAFALMNGFAPGNIDRQTEVLLQSLSVIRDLFFRKRIATTFPEMVWPRTPFIHGKSAMVLTTMLEMANWQNVDIDFMPRVIPLPFDNDASTLLLANAFMIPASSENAQLAGAFVRTALADETQRALTENTLFLSVKEPINRNAKPEAYLRLLNLSPDRMDNNYFINELFEDRVWNTLEENMSMFWLGLDSPDVIVEKFANLCLEHSNS